MQDHRTLLESLPALQRLALSYCPAFAFEPTLALLALDARFASLIRGAVEPMLAQLRIAWWREMLRGDCDDWPGGEPLLAALHSWKGNLPALAGLADGWEAMTAASPLPASAMVSLAGARGEAFSELARLLGRPGDQEKASQCGYGWALCDIASRLTREDERESALSLVAACNWGPLGLSRALRPLTVLHGLAARSARKGDLLGEGGLPAMASAVRLGLLGR